MKLNSLIIVSVPFARNARFFISSEIFKKLAKHNDVLIVSPFSDKSNFQQEFGGPNTYFLSVKPEPKIVGIFRYFYYLSEYLRTNGYWFRFRKRPLAYYWKLSVALKIDRFSNRYVKNSLKGKCITYLTGCIGYFKFVWLAIDTLLGRFFYDTGDIAQYALQYKNVLLIQTANFGFQERFLAYCARKFSFKSLFIPYTTDQLITNGYLINNFDSICTQGPEETDYAIKYHSIAPERICRLGMLWLRNLDAMGYASVSNDTSRMINKKRILLYAGVSSTYFSKASELDTVDRIVKAIKNGLITNSRLIYRPVATKEEYDFIENKYQHEETVELQMPQYALVGMLDYPENSIREEVIEYIHMIRSIDMLIMSATTSLLFEALYFDKPVLSCFFDTTSALVNIGLLDSAIKDNFSVILPLVLDSPDSLVEKINEIFNNPGVYSNIKNEVFNKWDYHNQNYVSDFFTFINA